MAIAIVSALPEELCVEMEGAAVAQLCWDYQVPFIAVRTISDRADDTAHIDFPVFVRDVAGPYAVKSICAWLEQLPTWHSANQAAAQCLEGTFKC